MRGTRWTAAVLLVSGVISAAFANERQDAVLDALAAGEQARIAGDHAAMLGSAQRLTALGARPVRGEKDLARGWSAEARTSDAILPPAPAYRGAALGPAYKRGMVGPGERYSVAQLFLGGQPARVAVAAVGGIDGLSVKVRDGNGGKLCDKAVEHPRVECLWAPAYTARFDIVVENKGSRQVTFFLILK